MKTMDEISLKLSQLVPSDPVVKLLNETFGPLGWEFDGCCLKVNVKVNEGHFLTVCRYGVGLVDAAAMFGLEVKNGKVEAKDPPRQDSPAVATGSDRVGQSGGEPGEALPTGTPKPSRKVINASITESSQIILAKKLRSLEELKAMVEVFGVKRKEELTEEQALTLLEQLKEVLGQ